MQKRIWREGQSFLTDAVAHPLIGSTDICHHLWMQTDGYCTTRALQWPHQGVTKASADIIRVWHRHLLAKPSRLDANAFAKVAPEMATNNSLNVKSLITHKLILPLKKHWIKRGMSIQNKNYIIIPNTHIIILKNVSKWGPIFVWLPKFFCDIQVWDDMKMSIFFITLMMHQ